MDRTESVEWKTKNEWMCGSAQGSTLGMKIKVGSENIPGGYSHADSLRNLRDSL